MLLLLQQNNLLESGDIPPVFSGPIQNIFQRQNTGTFSYSLGSYFAGADSYAIDPAVETGWTFDTNTGVLVIDTDAIGNFGPFTVTATNASGDTDSNAFYVEVAVANTGAGRSRRRRYLVEIDGQDFEVSGIDEAQALLERAKAVATKAIEKASSAPSTRVARGRPGIPRPVIRTADPELKAVVRQAQFEIAEIYDSAVRDMEIRALLAKREEEDEEEALIRLLM